MRQSRKADQRPAFQFYPDDWLAEISLRVCTAFDRGLWIDMLCIMWRAERRGFLEVNGSRLEADHLARLVAEPQANVKQSLSRMEAAGVFETDEDGTIYNRRMVREEKQRLSKVEAGRRGGRKQTPSKSQAKRGSPTPTPTPTPTSSPPLPPSEPRERDMGDGAYDHAERLADHLRERIRDMDPKAHMRPKRFDTSPILGLIIDGQDPGELTELIDHAFTDDFWIGKVLTGNALANCVNQLRASMKRPGDKLAEWAKGGDASEAVL